MSKLTEKHLAQQADAVGLTLFPRYDSKDRRIFDVCSSDGQGRPDLSRSCASGLTSREVSAFLRGVEYGQRRSGGAKS